jgi:predicted AlkP superfamily pyrophosphatase or phosphodiesterase
VDKVARRGALALAVAVVAGLSWTAGGGSPRPRAVIVCWDGAKPAVMEAMAREGRLPAYGGLVRRGCAAPRAETVLPSSTLPSHVSMVTGVEPEVHGVTWNSERPGALLGAGTIFEEAKKAGLRTALVVSKRKLLLLAKPGTVDDALLVEGKAGKTAAAALCVLRKRDPDLLFVHFRDPDEAGHEFGWGDTELGIPPSSRYEASLRACDGATGRLLRALEREDRWERTLFILTADHGGRGKNHGSADPQERTIPWVAAGGAVKACGPWPAVLSTCDTAATALWALGLPVPQAWRGRPAPVLAPPEPAPREAKKAA